MSDELDKQTSLDNTLAYFADFIIFHFYGTFNTLAYFKDAIIFHFFRAFKKVTIFFAYALVNKLESITLSRTDS